MFYSNVCLSPWFAPCSKHKLKKPVANSNKLFSFLSAADVYWKKPFTGTKLDTCENRPPTPAFAGNILKDLGIKALVMLPYRSLVRGWKSYMRYACVVVAANM